MIVPFGSRGERGRAGEERRGESESERERKREEVCEWGTRRGWSNRGERGVLGAARCMRKGKARHGGVPASINSRAAGVGSGRRPAGTTRPQPLSAPPPGAAACPPAEMASAGQLQQTTMTACDGPPPTGQWRVASMQGGGGSRSESSCGVEGLL